ncbi:predicted protein [Candida tropicalis MYA-3404]|uniref:Uncharacterized protein n=1 Tax=Candida tropicalis (strain ATCC MYA-3404 / T1) TaxID=294747 RepID=C5MCJ6_CANTT|nr:predicted protein [Candida tropicalis MYA-3404]EER32275.1 predicted protein [Candida tropicalis MYA-3404]KAG4405879.1 hypothetical protein JTP64_004750 [Candida tropicalis]
MIPEQFQTIISLRILHNADYFLSSYYTQAWLHRISCVYYKLVSTIDTYYKNLKSLSTYRFLQVQQPVLTLVILFPITEKFCLGIILGMNSDQIQYFCNSSSISIRFKQNQTWDWKFLPLLCNFSYICRQQTFHW